ncbi:MAG TPA: hypothetical protein VLL52_00425 [Anaerolineae bacterium]|nr:hypothetical protein [Anaerolineae bacterium]
MLTGDREAAKGDLVRVTVGYTLMLGVWFIILVMALAWWAASRYPQGAPDWVGVPVLIILSYPVFAIGCLGQVWRKWWLDSMVRKKVLRWLMVPFGVLFIGVGGILLDVAFVEYDVELHDFAWAEMIDEDVFLPIDELTEEVSFDDELAWGFRDNVVMPVDTTAKDIFFWERNGVMFVSQRSPEEMEQFYRNVFGNEYGAREWWEGGGAEPYQFVIEEFSYASRRVEVYIMARPHRGSIVGFIHCEDTVCTQRALWDEAVMKGGG